MNFLINKNINFVIYLNALESPSSEKKKENMLWYVFIYSHKWKKKKFLSILMLVTTVMQYGGKQRPIWWQYGTLTINTNMCVLLKIG